MKKKTILIALMSLLLLALLAGTALADRDHSGDKSDDHSKTTTLSCPACPSLSCPDAPDCVCPACPDVVCGTSGSCPACPTLTCPPAAPAAPAISEGVYNVCRYRSNGTRRCKRVGFYKLYDNVGRDQ